MLRAGVIAAAALALPIGAASNTLTVNLWPDSDPDSAIYCTISLTDGRLTVVQAKGLGFLNPRPLRWWASDGDQSVFLSGIQALILGEIPSDSPRDAPRLSPPFLTVTWVSNLDGQITSGRYSTRAMSLPTKLATLLDTVTPGSYCSPDTGS